MTARRRSCSSPSVHRAFGRYIIIGTTGLSAGTLPSASAFQRRGSLENRSGLRSTSRAVSYPMTAQASTPGAISTGTTEPWARRRVKVPMGSAANSGPYRRSRAGEPVCGAAAPPACPVCAGQPGGGTGPDSGRDMVIAAPGK